MIVEFLELTFSRHDTCNLLCDTSLALARSSPTRRYTGNYWRPSNDHLIPESRIRRQLQHENAPPCRECNRNPLSNHFLLTIAALAPPDCGAPTVQHPQPF